MLERSGIHYTDHEGRMKRRDVMAGAQTKKKRCHNADNKTKTHGMRCESKMVRERPGIQCEPQGSDDKERCYGGGKLNKMMSQGGYKFEKVLVVDGDVVTRYPLRTNRVRERRVAMLRHMKNTLERMGV